MAEHEHGGQLRAVQGMMHELTCDCGEVSYIFLREEGEPLVLSRLPATWTVNGIERTWPPKNGDGDIEPEKR